MPDSVKVFVNKYTINYKGIGEKVTIDKKGIYHIASPALVSANYRYNFITIDYTKTPFKPVKINSIGIRDYDLQ